MPNKEECYEIKTLKFDDGLFDNCISATYVIHLSENGREQQIYSNLSDIHPSRLVHIVYNKGFRKCFKGDHVKDTVSDLTSTYLWIFRDAIKKDYNNILILEDDFIFDDKIRNPKHIHSIQDFINKNANNEFCYLLGCLPFLMTPHNNHCNVVCGGMHSVIYSNPLIKRFSMLQPTDIGDWDVFLQLNTTKIAYYTPLCYQLFPYTENMSNWGGDSIILRPGAFFLINYIRLLSLHNSVYPGYEIAYYIAKILWWLIIVLIIYSFYKFVKWIGQIRNKKGE
jgi:hypothetical protein